MSRTFRNEATRKPRRVVPTVADKQWQQSVGASYAEVDVKLAVATARLDALLERAPRPIRRT